MSTYSRESALDVQNAFELLAARVTQGIAAVPEALALEALDTLQTHIAALTAEADAQKQPLRLSLDDLAVAFHVVERAAPTEDKLLARKALRGISAHIDGLQRTANASAGILDAKRHELLQTVRAIYPAIMRHPRLAPVTDDLGAVKAAIEIARAIHVEIDNLKDEEV